MNQSEYRGIPIIIKLNNAKTGAFGGGDLKLMPHSRLTFDPSYPDIDHSNCWEYDWTDFYEGAVEAILPNALLAKGKEVD